MADRVHFIKKTSLQVYSGCLLTSFAGFFSWLVNEEIMDAKANPMKRIPRPKVPHKIIEDIPLQLVRKAIEECGNGHFRAARNRAIILLFLDTGTRLSVCAGITMPDIDPEAGLARVWEKGGQQVIIHLNETARAVLKHYLALRSHHTSESLWLKEDGTTLTKSAIQSMIRRLRKCGFDYFRKGKSYHINKQHR